MKLSRFDLEKRMSIADMKLIKAGCATCNTGGNSCTCSGTDVEQGGKESDY
jgi:hypothetical protein